MVPPKKHLLRHQPANAQIGLMEGNTFCTTLQPRLFTMDLNVMEHKVFYTEVCEVQKTLLNINQICFLLFFLLNHILVILFISVFISLCVSPPLFLAVEPV